MMTRGGSSNKLYHVLLAVVLLVLSQMDNVGVSSFQLVMMGAKRGKGTLKKTLDGGTAGQPTSSRSLNKGKGQEITGVTLPADGKNMKSN